MSESGFLLSDFTQAIWLDKGGLQLSRIKEEGDDFVSGYKVYVPYQSCRTIFGKQQIIQDSALGIIEGLIDSPCNICLFKQQVVRLSLYYEELYYGIHSLDSQGKVKVGKGMNLSELEFDELLVKLKKRFEPEKQKEKKMKSKLSEQAGTAEKAQERGKKRRCTTNVGEQEIGGEKEVSIGNIATAKCTDFSQFWGTVYGWTWYSETDAQYVSSGETQGHWHFNPKDCFFEAMSFKPSDGDDTEDEIGGKLKLDVFHKKELIKIDDEMMNTALAKLMKVNVAMCVEEDKTLNLYNSTWNNIEVYGKTVLDRISHCEVYDLCKKAIKHYCTINQDMELMLMKKFADYEKKDSILASIMNADLQETLVDMFDFIYTV